MRYNLFLILIILAGCTEEEPLPFNQNAAYPVTVGYEDLDDSGITLKGDVAYMGKSPVSSFGFIWEADELKYKVAVDAAYGRPFSHRVTSDLDPDKTYHYRAYAESGGTMYVGIERTFNPLGAKAPVITGVSPPEGERDQEVTLRVDHLSYRPGRNRIRFNGQSVPVLRQDQNSLTFRVPENADGGTAQIVVSVGELNSDVFQGFTTLGPLITGLSASSGYQGDIIEIYGSGWAVESVVKAFFESNEYFRELVILERTPDKIVVVVDPSWVTQARVLLEIDGYRGDAAKAPVFNVQPRWKMVGEVPWSMNSDWVEFQGEIIRADHKANKLFRFDPATLSQELILETTPIEVPLVVLGANHLYRFGYINYDPPLTLVEWNLVANEQVLINTFPLDFRREGSYKYTFDDNTAYLFADNKSFWVFDMENASLTQRRDWFTRDFHFLPYVRNGELFIYTASETYRYVDATDEWVIHEINNTGTAELYHITEYNGELYLFTGLGVHKYLDKYNRWIIINTQLGTARNTYEFNGLHAVLDEYLIYKLQE